MIVEVALAVMQRSLNMIFKKRRRENLYLLIGEQLFILIFETIKNIDENCLIKWLEPEKDEVTRAD